MSLYVRGRCWIAAAAALVVLLAIALPARAAGLEHVATQRLSPRLQELTFRTPALDGDTKVRVLLPTGYGGSGRTRYPVLYLLHGALDDYTSWTAKGDAAAITARYRMIVVMPDGGTDGGYSDWYNGGKWGQPAWETYHIRQLLPWIDAHYRTIATRSGRAVAGLSMGGGGAMKYAARHPELFTAAGSFSGAVDSNNIFVQPLTETAGWSRGAPPGSEYGPRATDEIRWRGNNPWDLAENLQGMLLQVDTGNGNGGGPGGDTGDPVEAGVHQQSVSFHQRLLDLGIPHIWDDYGAGGHAWYYWMRDLRQFLPRLQAEFAHPPKAPVPFDFTSIDPHFGTYGWRVRINRPALEFGELAGASRRGFRLRGSGTAVVTTAGYYRPGSRFDVTMRDPEGTTSRIRRADRKGRLTLPLTLGPGNPYQEYSPEARAWLAQRNAPGDTGRPLDEASDWPVYTVTVRIARHPAVRG